MELDRRELFRIIAAGVTVGSALGQEHQHSAGAAKIDLASYTPRALSPAQYGTLDTLAELLLPAGSDGPGAHEAGVAFYLDTVLFYGGESQKAFWGRELDNAATHSDLDALLTSWAQNEASPQTDGQLFFVALKNATISAFFLSDAGRKCAGYRGDTAIPSFPGCTHPEHQHIG